MGGNVAWNKHEAVILLDAYVTFLKGKISRTYIVRMVSADLRKMAVNNGEIIGGAYRNEKGISYQIMPMESAYRGKTVIVPATQLFKDIVALYNDNRKEYEKLLREAREMINAKRNRKDDFTSWLGEFLSAAVVEEIIDACDKIEVFGRTFRILEAPLFETTKVETLNSVQYAMSRNRVFCIINASSMKYIDMAMSYLMKYIKGSDIKDTNTKGTQNQDILVQKNSQTPAIPEKSQKIGEFPPKLYIRTEQDKRLVARYPYAYKNIFQLLRSLTETNPKGVTIEFLYHKINRTSKCADIEDILDNASWSMRNGREYTFSETLTTQEKHTSQQEKIAETEPTETKQASDNAACDNSIESEQGHHFVNFATAVDYANTTPTSLTYFGDPISGFTSWAELYAAFFTTLYADYSHLLKVGVSFAGNAFGHIDLSDAEGSYKMAAPKQIKGTSLYLETGLCNEEVVDNIKFLLDICQVDFENIVIEYKKEPVSDICAVPQASHKHTHIQINFNIYKFMDFLQGNEGIAQDTCNVYVSAIREAECYARGHRLEHNQLFTTDYQEAKATADMLLRTPAFIAYSSRQENYFCAAVDKLLIFLKRNAAFTKVQRVSAPTHSAAMHASNEKYLNILTQKFNKGFRIKSPIDLHRFKLYYAQAYNTKIESEDAMITNDICLCGILYDGKIFVPRIMLENEVREKLFAYIQNSFEEGKTTLFYQVIFDKFHDDFLNNSIFTVDMLKEYLHFMLKKEYYFNKSHLTKEANTTVLPIDEIRSCLKEHAGPMTYDLLFQNIKHISQQKIKQILTSNSEFINNGPGEFFHISAVQLSAEDIENIAEIINYVIEEKKFLSSSELVDAIEAKYPDLYDKNDTFTLVGWRNTIKYHLCEQFAFSGNIISKLGSDLDMSDVFANYCQSVDSFTLDELELFAKELDTGIYFDTVYKNSLRISHEQFVAKRYAKFLVSETDIILDRFCPGDYIPISMVDNFSFFPEAGFQWNEYLLEHYVAAYSEKYTLMHTGFSSDKCVGAIAKKSAGFGDFNECVTKILADSNATLKKQEALQHLCDEGYIARRSLGKIEELLIRATALRNRKGVN